MMTTIQLTVAVRIIAHRLAVVALAGLVDLEMDFEMDWCQAGLLDVVLDLESAKPVFWTSCWTWKWTSRWTVDDPVFWRDGLLVEFVLDLVMQATRLQLPSIGRLAQSSGGPVSSAKQNAGINTSTTTGTGTGTDVLVLVGSAGTGTCTGTGTFTGTHWF